MKKTARIGITLDMATNDGTYVYADRPWYALRKCYSDCVIKAGGLAFMLTYQNNIEDILDNLDGLVFSGGDNDIPPSFYHEEIQSNKVKANYERAEFEQALLRSALKRNMPILGICNGIQAINVSLGGSLIQHIPDAIKSDIKHEQPKPKDTPSHEIELVKDTKLYSLAKGEQRIMVNSTHHQAVKELGNGLIISALATDGIIEAIESIDHQWVIGVQWHAEYLNTNLDRNLFAELIIQASKYN